MATKPTSVLVTDRTAADVANRTEKGFNSLSDIARVQSWVNYFIDETGQSLPKYTWVLGERVDAIKWQTYVLHNIKELLKSYPELSVTVPTIDKWDWYKQNQIESILLAMSNAEPVRDPVSFATDSWGTIMSAIQKGIYRDYYHVNDTREESLKDGSTVTFTLRAYDTMDIAAVSGGGKSNMVISCTSDEKYQLHSENVFGSGNLLRFSKTDMKNKVLPSIYEKLDDKLKNFIKTTRVKSQYVSWSGSSGKIYEETFEDKLFIEGRPAPVAGYGGTNGTIPYARQKTYSSLEAQEAAIAEDGKWTKDINSDGSHSSAKAYVASGYVSGYGRRDTETDITERYKICWSFCL